MTSEAEEHERRVDALLHGHLERRRRGIKHPVEDFLFTYYSYRPAQLRKWRPDTTELKPEHRERTRRRSRRRRRRLLRRVCQHRSNQQGRHRQRHHRPSCAEKQHIDNAWPSEAP